MTVPNPGEPRSGPASADASTPSSLVLVLFRGAMTLVLGAYFFAVYCVVRAMLGGIGLDWGSVLRSLVATAVMSGFVVWLAPLLELPEIWFRHRVPQSRRARGLCPECGYAMDRKASICPECGSDGTLRPAWQFGTHTLARFAIVAASAYVAGCAAAALWMAADERAFLRESAVAAGHYERSRSWPVQFARLVRRDDGTVHAPGIGTEGTVDPDWKPRAEPVP